MEKAVVSRRFDKYLRKRFGVSAKELEDWLNEYIEDKESGAIFWCSKDNLKLVNKYLYDITVQRKYRLCDKYEKIGEGIFEGHLKNTDNKIRIEKDLKLRGDRYKNLSLYINDQLIGMYNKQVEVINALENYLNEYESKM